MKQLLLIPMLFVCYLGMGQSNIIGKPIKIGKIKVAQNDLSDKQNFDDAKAKCRNLGEGWRLPTFDELKKIYDKRFDIGGLDGTQYWSSTLNDDGFSGAWYKNFWFNAQNIDNLANSNTVRCVKNN